MEQKYIPAFPYGAPSGDLRVVIDDVFAKAGIDMGRLIEPPFASKERVSKTGSSPEAAPPSQEIVLQRFVTHAGRSRTNLANEIILALPYKGGVETFISLLARFAKELPFIPLAASGRNVLLLPDGASTNVFREEAHLLGVLEGGLDNLHKGARLHTRKHGSFFILTWSPTIANRELGNLLSVFIRREADHLMETDRHSMTPQAFPAFEMPTSVRRADSRKEPSDPPTTVTLPKAPEPSPAPEGTPSSSFQKSLSHLGQIPRILKRRS